MMTLNQVAQAMAQALNKCENVALEPPAEVTEPVIVPTVSIASDALRDGGRAVERTFLVDVASYAPQVAQSAFYAFVADMDLYLRPTMMWYERAVTPQEVRASIVDGVGHYTFTAALCDVWRTQEMAGSMEELVIDTNVEEGL